MKQSLLALALLVAPLVSYADASNGGEPITPCFNQQGDMIHSGIRISDCQRIGATPYRK